MPRERLSWVPAFDWAALNARLRRAFELTDGSSRLAVQPVAATGTLTLSWPWTLVPVDTSGGSVTLTLPPAAPHVGYRLEVKKLTAANTVTLDGAGSETIDGAATLAWTTQWQSYSVVSTGTAWVIV